MEFNRKPIWSPEKLIEYPERKWPFLYLKDAIKKKGKNDIYHALRKFKPGKKEGKVFKESSEN